MAFKPYKYKYGAIKTQYNQFSRTTVELFKRHVMLGEKATNLDDWWIDADGLIGHDCNWKLNQGEEPIFLGKTFKGYNAGKGVFQRTCLNCDSAAPEALEFQAKLRRLG